MQATTRLTVVALLFHLSCCEKPSITAEDALTIGRKACEATQKRQIPISGDIPQPRIAPTDWKATLDGRDWVVAANDATYYFTVVVTASGKALECKLRHVDA